MSWREEIGLVPSRNPEMLRALLGRSLTRLVHYPTDVVEDLLAEEAFAARGVTAQQLFAYGGGPVLLTLDDARTIVVSASEELISVTIRSGAMFDSDDWPSPIDATDPTYSEPTFASCLLDPITRVTVAQLQIIDPSGWSPKAQDRPREVQLALYFQRGVQLVFSTLRPDTPANFAVDTQPVPAPAGTTLSIVFDSDAS